MCKFSILRYVQSRSTVGVVRQNDFAPLTTLMDHVDVMIRLLLSEDVEQKGKEDGSCVN